MQWNKPQDGYPRKRAQLPRATVEKYREILFKQGIYPLGGKITEYGEKTPPGLSDDSRLLQEEIDKEYQEKIAKKLGINIAELPDFTPAPGVARLGTGALPSRYDPQPVGFLGKHFVRRQGWQQSLEVVDVINQWEEYVGSQVAAHTRIEEFNAGKLVIRTDSSTWATQLKWLIPQLEKRLAQKLGTGTVKQVIIRGPLVPSWKHGPYSVPGRGPRDTYG